MPCERTRDLIGAFVDCELAESEARAVAQHIDTCPACAREAQEIRRLGRQVAAVGVRTSPASNARVSRALREEAARVPAVMVATRAPGAHTPPRPRRQWLAPAAMAATLMLVTALATWWLTSRADHRAAVERDVMSAHIRALIQDSAVQIASSEQHQVKPWFQGRVEFAPVVRDLASEGFPLAGARLDYVDGRRVGALVYKRRLHVVSVFVWPAEGSDRAALASRRNGYNIVEWTKAGMTYWAVSDLNEGELKQLQGLL